MKRETAEWRRVEERREHNDSDQLGTTQIFVSHYLRCHYAELESQIKEPLEEAKECEILPSGGTMLDEFISRMTHTMFQFVLVWPNLTANKVRLIS